MNNFPYNNRPESGGQLSQNNNLNINKTVTFIFLTQSYFQQNTGEKRNNYITPPNNASTNFSQGIQNKNKQGPIKLHNDNKSTNLSIVK